MKSLDLYQREASKRYDQNRPKYEELLEKEMKKETHKDALEAMGFKAVCSQRDEILVCNYANEVLKLFSDV